jgi:hypothetical protein
MLASNAPPNPDGLPPPAANDDDEPLSHQDFLIWLVSAEKGQRCVWHAGFLPTDRQSEDDMPVHQRISGEIVDAYARNVLALYERGHVLLTQQKVRNRHYLYYATISRST